MRDGQQGLNDFIEEIREQNLDWQCEMSQSAIDEFLRDYDIAFNDLKPDTQDELRFILEDNVRWNVEDLFDYSVLLIDDKYNTDLYSGGGEIDDPEFAGLSVGENYEKWKKKALEYAGKDGVREVINNMGEGGNGFIGITVNGKDIIEIIDKGDMFISGDAVVGVENEMAGSGYYVSTSKNHKVSTNISHISHGSYSIGAVFGTSERRY